MSGRLLLDLSQRLLYLREMVASFPIVVIFSLTTSVSLNAKVHQYSDLGNMCEHCPEITKIRLDSSSQYYLVMRHELTWSDYRWAALERNCIAPSDPFIEFGDPNSWPSDSYPITGVPIGQIKCYIDWLNDQTGRKFRLPTRAEWTKLALAGSNEASTLQLASPEGGGEIGKGDVAPVPISDKRSAIRLGHIRPVGLGAPNAWGLYDTIGNVAEATSEEKCFRKRNSTKLDCNWAAVMGGSVLNTRPIGIIESAEYYNIYEPNFFVGFRFIALARD